MPSPVEPSVVRVRSERMVAGGHALARDADGRIVFVAGAAPDETVDAVVRSNRKGVLHAVVLTVVEPSIDRVAPPCPQVALGCGGCDWQHLSPEAQRRARRGIVRESLRRVGRLPDDVIERALEASVPDTSATTGALPVDAVRTTLRLAIDGSGRAGFREAGTHTVVTTDRCLVAHPRLEELLPSIDLPGALEVNLRIGVGTGERGMWWSPPEVVAPKRLPDDVRLGADAVVHEVIDGLVMRVSPGSFFQPSPEAAHAIVAAVRRVVAEPLERMEPDELVVDAYAGVGLLASTVVPSDRSVLAIEGSRSACGDAIVNLAGRNARVLRCSVEKWRAEAAALVIADPARSGLGAEACRRLVASRPRDIVLVSCDPASLGRDAALLASHGFDLVSCTVLDAFPHTHHVEAVSHFARVR